VAVYQDYFTTDAANTPINNATGWTTRGSGPPAGSMQSQTVSGYWGRQLALTYNTGNVVNNTTIDAPGGSLTDAEILTLTKTGSHMNATGNTLSHTYHFNSAGTSLGAYMGCSRDASSNFFFVLITNNATAYINKVWNQGEYWWLRSKVSGTTLFGKAWKFGTTEPTSWDNSTGGITVSSGYCGYSFQNNSSFTIGGETLLYYGLGTGTNPAPWPKLLPPSITNTNSTGIQKIKRGVHPHVWSNTSTVYSPGTEYTPRLLPTLFQNNTEYHQAQSIYNQILYADNYQSQANFLSPHTGFYYESALKNTFKNWKKPTSGMFRGFHYTKGLYY